MIATKHFNILRFFVSCLAFASACSLFAQDSNDIQATGEAPKPTKYVAVEEQKQKLVFFQGFTLSADLFGPVSYFLSDYGTLEGALRLNLKNTYLPIVELGVGQCDIKDDNTNISYKARAPFMRVGVDFNLLNNKFQDNRLYAGFRYGISKFSYDIAGPAMVDPVWGGSSTFDVKGIDCTSHWGEIVAGVEVKVTGNLHMGWLVRYKRELHSTKSDYAKPSCIPGYGKTTDDSCWGGTYSLIFDLNWGLKKSKKKGVIIDVRDISAPENEDANTVNDNKTEQSGDQQQGVTDNNK